ncbi:Protein SST2 [Candida viswanathii]|uniref:Protein SST2 n=1 Tax=Candida viswanathii TaxID=5486 RepID=A0A367Y3G4_9ASCO|nr:Protein SST2 [Candida viswanathii]
MATTASITLSSDNNHSDEGFSADEQIGYTATTALTTRSSESSSDKLESLSSSSCILHEATHHKFNRTKSGRIFEKDLKDIYALLIISLDLKRDVAAAGSFPSSIKKFNSLLTKKYPYSFTLESAIECMKDLKLTIELASTITRISYSFKPEMSLSLISQFYKAKFLHSPADRTRGEPKPSVSLQPTPKGLAIVQEFCERVGLDKEALPEILLAHDFNTMSLFKFDRDLSTDKILYSEYFLHLLFNLLMGPKPNVWTASNKPDPLPETSLLDKENYESFNHNISDYVRGKQAPAEGGFSFTSFQKAPSSKQTTIDPGPANNKAGATSPYYHRYFTNPESEAHMQYYVSSVGVRLLRDKEISNEFGKTITVDYCTSGKAICQWILDCTDVINPKHAHEIASLLLKSGLIREVVNSGEEVFSRERYYKLTRLGHSISQWDKSTADGNQKNIPERLVQISSKKSNTNAGLTLEDVLNDPGMRFQFRKHLNKEYCIENLESYTHLVQFEKKYCLWEKLKDFVDNPSQGQVAINHSSVETHMNNLVATCISIAYQIFNTYLSADSPFIVNIDFKLRSKITDLMTSHEYKEGTQRDNESIKYLETPTDDNASTATTPVSDKEAEKGDIAKMDQVQASEANLKEIAALLSQVRAQVYRLMEVDSIPKFLETLSKDHIVIPKGGHASSEK